MIVRTVKWLFTVVCVFTLVRADGGCTFGSFDLSPLSSFNPWISKDGNTTYTFNICGAQREVAGGCPAGTTVCSQTAGKSAMAMGTHSTTNFTTNHTDAALLMFTWGADCAEISGEKMVSIIFFKCGKSLGSPVLLGMHACAAYFEWRSHAVCKDMKKPAKEVPCYIYSNSYKFDLSPLMKDSGGYTVTSSDGSTEVTFNVCRDIDVNPADGDPHCGDGVASCRFSVGADGAKTPRNMGEPKTGLQVDAQGHLQLRCTSSSTPAGCVGNSSTTINFICPKRGGSQDPKLVSDMLCNNVIEWQTEYACPESKLKSSTCQLTQESHDIDIDLSPLRGENFQVTSGDYTYGLRICGDLSVPCEGKSSSDTHAAACQMSNKDQDKSWDMGHSNQMELGYVDGDLMLTYKDGSPCHTGFKRETIITFQCNPNAANNGKGTPTFREENDCTYLFDWETKYACLDHPLETLCGVNSGKQRFDLSALTRESGQNWVALTNREGKEEEKFFINVCHDLLQTGEASGCPSDSSICRKESSGAVKSLGKYTAKSNPVYDASTNSIKINYFDGGLTEDGAKINTTITLTCSPGNLESAPVLAEAPPQGWQGHYEFTWGTAAACPLSHKSGQNCRVDDDSAGFMFDLSPLTRTPDKPYKVTTNDYDFYLNVCGSVTGTACDNGHTNAAICQVSKTNAGSGVFKLGEPNDKLSYYDGMINLTYTNGDPYNDAGHTPRKAAIAFQCDPDAGTGTPQFLTESQSTYTFLWNTALACPAQPIECVVVDQLSGKEYDLSGLAQSSDNWAVEDTSGTQVKKFYLNVCHPVISPHIKGGGTCDAFAAVCATDITGGQETLLHPNLGQAADGPVVVAGQTGQLTLTYSHGGPCTLSNGTTSTFTTTVHFVCRQGELSKGPQSPRQLNECEYSFLWETEEACPKADQTQSDQNDCRVKDPDSDFTFDLSPLTKKNGFYTTNSTDGLRTFRLNVCGGVTVGTGGCDKLESQTGEPGLCEVQPSRRPSLAEANSKLTLSPTGQLSLTYKGGRVNLERRSLTITFICNRNPAQEGPGPVTQESMNYRLQFFTPLACPPQPVDCTVQDSQGRQVDLSPLARSDANWVISDGRDSHSNLRYFINVCRPLVPVPGTSCPGGAVGGCQHGDESFNLGYIQSKPTIAADGSVTLRYQGGTVCHQGTPNEAPRSMRINFLCSAIERSPRFVMETNTCEYIFSWETPSACPVKQDVGHDCKVTDSLYNHEFDLSPLKKTGSDYRVRDGEYEYLISLCGPLQQGSEACTGRSGVAVCQTKPGGQSFYVPAGSASSELVYSLGEITLTYSDGQANCHGKYNRSTVITFICDHGQDGTGGPTFLKEDFDCTYMFEWRTKHACPPFAVSDCTQVRGNKQYDFSGLARTDDNYETTLFSQQKKFYINVCKPVVPHKGLQCPYDAAVCMDSMAETDPAKKFHSLGRASESPVEMNGQTLQIRYTNGEPCGSNKTTSSVLVMLCDPNAIDTEPELPYKVDDCEWHFSWKTALACENAVTANATGANCRTKNPVSGYEFDLSALKKDEGYLADDMAGHTYLVSVCAPLGSSANKCSNPQSGSCQNETIGEKRFFNSGLANGNLVYEGDGVLTLTYTGGDVCHHNNVPRTTIIRFYCSQGAGNGHPVYVSMTDGCTYFFNWPTDLACEQQVECKVDVGNYTVDLSPLVRPVGHYQARNMLNDGAVYYVNLCRPLNPIFGLRCPPGSAVCMSELGQPPKSLGRVAGEPTYDVSTGHVRLTYDHGERCPQDPSKNLSTLIVFRCNAGSLQGDLQLDSGPVGSSCTYVFTWETSAVCAPDASVSEGSGCSFRDTQRGQVFDLSALKAPVEVSVSGGTTYRLQVCGAPGGQTGGCQGAAVCRNSTDSFGLASTGQFAMQDDDLGLTFSQGRQCGLGKASAQIIFECSQEAGEGRPELTQPGDCFVEFRWKTSYVCPPVTAPCSLQNGADFFDLTPLSQTSSSWKHKDASGNVYWINLCQGLHGEALSQGCQADAAVCQVSSSGVTTMLGTVASQHLSLEAGGGLLLEYSQGVCGGGRRRSEHQQASARIHLQCADTSGAPVLQPRKDQDLCTFDFLWKSRLACKESNHTTVIQDVNHVLKDPRTGLTINLNSKGLSEEKVYSEAGNTFHISLVGKVARDKQLTESHACDGAAVCLSKSSDPKFYRDLGQYDTRKYFVEDDVFEVQYESHENCPGQQTTKIKTIISFKCSTDGTEGQPDLISNAGDCFYVFHWYTGLACLHSQVHENPAVEPGATDQSKTAQNAAGKGPISNKTVGIIVGIFVSVAVVCIILVIFHKRETREAFAFRVKNLVLCRKGADQGIKYSVLSQNEEEVLEQDGDVEEGIRATGGAVFLSADSVQTEGMGNLNSYHDDSDDDLLL